MNLNVLYSYGAMSKLSKRKIVSYKNSFKDQNIYIVGTGPSILDTDLSRLEDKIVIFLNNAFRLTSEFSPKNAFVVISDHLRAMELRTEIERRSIETFVTTDKVLNNAVDPRIFQKPYIFLMPKLNTKTNGEFQFSAAFGFSDDIQTGVYLGKSVVFPAIQVAYFLGASTISLVGVDMTLGRNAKYYDPRIGSNWGGFSYAKDGRPHFEVILNCLRERGRFIENLTVGGALDVLPHDPVRLSKSTHVLKGVGK